MLSFDLIGKWAGVVLWSDYLSLRQIHGIVHDVNERSTLIADKEGLLLNLAYDLRKAHDGQRRIQKSDNAQPELGPRFGVEILWPTLLVQSRQLRDSLAYMDHTKEHQAVNWELEFMIEKAIEAEFKEKASEIKAEWEALSGNHAFIEENAETRFAQFAAWTVRERRRGLAGLLTSLNSMYERMYPFWTSTRIAAKRHLVPPAAFELWKHREFPNPGF